MGAHRACQPSRLARRPEGRLSLKTPLVILGTGVFAEEIADLVAGSTEFDLVGFVEGVDRDRCAQPFLDLPVTWIEDIRSVTEISLAVCAVGSTRRERFIAEARAAGLRFATLVHPGARVLPSATLAEGVIVSVGAVVGARTRVGAHTILNRGCLVGHHVEIGRYVTLGPGANIAAKVRIGDGTYVGMGAIVIDRVSIGSGCMIGAGAVVARDLPDRVQAVGAPARVVRRNIERV